MILFESSLDGEFAVMDLCTLSRPVISIALVYCSLSITGGRSALGHGLAEVHVCTTLLLLPSVLLLHDPFSA